MSIIQSIRDKAAWIVIGAIALALIAFIVQDRFQYSNFFGSNPTVLGTVNGQEIDAVKMEERYKQAEEQYRNAGYPMNDMMRQNIREGLWNEYVEDAIMSKKYEKLGLAVTDKELGDILYGANPPQDLRQQFTDPNTGRYDANAAYQQIQALRKQKTSSMYKNFFGQYIPALEKNRKKEKYTALLSNSAYIPKWMVEKLNTDNSQQASISYVYVPYNTISDSAVKVTDEEINEYVSKRKEFYKQERARGINYVMFDAAPTKGDSNSVYNQLQALKPEFLSTTDVPSFLIRNSSEIQYSDGYVLKSKMQPNTDTIQSLAEGAVYGPYLDAGNYVVAKMISKRTIPDSIKVRHILIKTADQGKPVLDDSTAKKRIDSIVNAIKGGVSFDSMVVKYSDDLGSKDKKGEYEFSSTQFSTISKEFAEVIFYGKTGDKKTVKVDNQQYTGYHYMEVLSQKNFEPAFKIAYLAKAIVPSDETVNSAMGLASQFAAENRKQKAFEESAKKKGLSIMSAADIKPMETMIPGLGSSRELVQWMYKADKGDVADRPMQVGDKYVVAVLTHVYEEGTQDAQRTRPLVEHIIRNEKKAGQIIKKIGNANSLDAVSKAVGQPVNRADSVLFATPFIPNVGQESKVVGASFNKHNQTAISKPIAGNSGVFVIKVENISAIANPNFNAKQQQEQQQQMLQRTLANPTGLLEILKKSAKIKDNRHKFF